MKDKQKDVITATPAAGAANPSKSEACKSLQLAGFQLLPNHAQQLLNPLLIAGHPRQLYCNSSKNHREATMVEFEITAGLVFAFSAKADT